MLPVWAPGSHWVSRWKRAAATAAANSLQSCPTLCNPTGGSPPGSSVHGILQARTLEWVAISSSNAWKWKVKVKSLSHVQLLVTPWTAASQAPPSMGFSRQEYWSGMPLPSRPKVTSQLSHSLPLEVWVRRGKKWRVLDQWSSLTWKEASGGWNKQASYPINPLKLHLLTHTF